MGPLKNFFKFKMETRYTGNKFIYCFIILLLFGLGHIAHADAKSRTPARILAKQTGATQFEEERYETHADCNEHKHHLKKRSSDEDIDYEVYQGVVGRPGIDFPIYPRIPRTSFSCRSFGNGYFADMETDCQVFHICEEGRKISFLCPNGTIFQQSELTCDWWFKVNCLGSPGYYAESAEILNKQRIQRVRPSVPVQGFNIVGGGLNIKPRVSNNVPRPSVKQPNNKSERRIDSNEEPSLENVDFDDLSGEKQLKGQKSKVLANVDNNSNDNESQITAESGSFVDGRRRNSYVYEKPQTDTLDRRAQTEGRNGGRNGNGGRNDGRRGNNGDNNNNGRNNGSNGNGHDTTSPRNGYNNNNNNQNNSNHNNNNNNDSNERARHGQRGQQRYREDKKNQSPKGESFEANFSNDSRETKRPAIIEKPTRPVIPVEGSSRSISGSPINAANEVTRKSQYTEPSTSTRKLEVKLPTTTPFYPSGTYSTARRLETTRSTPFYTPTVPSVVKSKTTDSKTYYIKGGSFGSSLTATTPTPNRFNTGTSSNFFLESSAAPKSNQILAGFITTTFRPFVIGMRHNYDNNSPERYRTSVKTTGRLDVDLPLQKANKKTADSGSIERIATTTATPSTGPTYLPKNSKAPAKALLNAGGEDFLFAPNPADNESVTRNVKEMLKTINLIKNKLGDAEPVNFQGQAREGLEIPPSSGPDALVSLAKYFAGEQSGSTANSLNALSNAEKPDKSFGKDSDSSTTQANARLPVKIPQADDKNAAEATTATTSVNVKPDDIGASLLSEKTVAQYSNLFGLQKPQGRVATDPSEGLLSHPNGTNKGDKNKSDFALFPPIGTTGATISELAAKTDSRKIAQVFSNALTTYLEDPKGFREQLASVRPTEPTVVSGKPNFVPVTVTDSSLFKSGTAATYLPTKSPNSGDRTTTPSSIASEINQKFEYSTPPDFISTTELFDTTTYRPRFADSREQKHKLELSAELAPPSSDSGEGEEFLQREQSQSFVKSRNNLSGASDKLKKSNDQYIGDVQSRFVAAKPTENPWNQISQTDFLDPLTINDGLMKEQRTTTPSPFTYLPKESTSTTTPQTTTLRGNVHLLSSSIQRSSATTPRPAQYTRYGSAEVTTTRTQDAWQDIFNTYDLPRDALPSSSGLQRIANKLFGGLNETEALHLKNVMQQAEHNRQVLSLLLLLIQACDDQNGKALERSRKHLLNALIDMDGKLATATATGGKVSHHKASGDASTTLNPLAATTTTNDPTWTTTTLFSSTSPYDGSSSTSGSSSAEETTKFEIRVEDPEEHTTTAASFATNNGSGSGGGSSSDARALELLKSLYSLASKFTNRR